MIHHSKILTHGMCRRCNKSSFNLTRRYCVSCSFGKSRKLKRKLKKARA